MAIWCNNWAIMLYIEKTFDENSIEKLNFLLFLDKVVGKNRELWNNIIFYNNFSYFLRNVPYIPPEAPMSQKSAKTGLDPLDKLGYLIFGFLPTLLKEWVSMQICHSLQSTILKIFISLVFFSINLLSHKPDRMFTLHLLSLTIRINLPRKQSKNLKNFITL